MPNPPFLGMASAAPPQPMAAPAGPQTMPPAYLSSRMGTGGFQMGGQNMADAPTTPPPGNPMDWVWGSGAWRYAPGQGQAGRPQMPAAPGMR